MRVLQNRILIKTSLHSGISVFSVEMVVDCTAVYSPPFSLNAELGVDYTAVYSQITVFN